MISLKFSFTCCCLVKLYLNIFSESLKYLVEILVDLAPNERDAAIEEIWSSLAKQKGSINLSCYFCLKNILIAKQNSKSLLCSFSWLLYVLQLSYFELNQ